jgi:flavorubredoxin
MMPFRMAVAKNLEKIKSLQIDMIAPSHGPVYDKPRFIIDAYKDWVSERVSNEVVLPYISMHGSTRKMVEYFVDALIERGIAVKQFNLAASDIGKLAISLVDAATVVVGSPTVLTGAHPLVAYACVLLNALRPKTKFASIIGSFGWGGRMTEQITGLIGNLKVEVLEPVIAKGHPEDDDFTALEKLADKILTKHKELGIV